MHTDIGGRKGDIDPPFSQHTTPSMATPYEGVVLSSVQLRRKLRGSAFDTAKLGRSCWDSLDRSLKEALKAPYGRLLVKNGSRSSSSTSSSQEGQRARPRRTRRGAQGGGNASGALGAVAELHVAARARTCNPWQTADRSEHGIRRRALGRTPRILLTQVRVA